MKEIRVQVPGTTANLGPGFDCLGVALKVRNVVTVSTGRGGGSDAMADEASEAFFRAAGRKPFAFRWKIGGDVPRSRGMGSSVTVRLGLLHGLNELSGKPLDKREVFGICADLEGHPDNAAPAAFGGFTIARGKDYFQRYRVDAAVRFVLLIPDFEVATKDARKVLPASVSLHDAAESAGNAAAIAAAFATGKYEALRGCFGDRLHQPYRQALMPFLPAVIEAGCSAGAIGGWLSGSGSTIACLTVRNPQAVGRAMFDAAGLPGARTIITAADNSGTRVLA
jgi:homoserine kinase